MDSTLVQITAGIVDAIQQKYQSSIEMAPYVVGAVALFVWGYILGELIYRGIIGMSKNMKLEYFADKVGLNHFLKNKGSKLTSSHVIAKSAKAYIVFLFFVESTKVARMNQVAEFLTEVIRYIPNVIIAIFIMLVGMRIGNTMSTLIRTSLSFTQSNTANVLGIAAKYTIFTFAVLASLSQLEIAEILIQTLFIGFVAMLTLAGGLAFGLGGKDVVKELLEAIKKVEIREYKKHVREEGEF